MSAPSHKAVPNENKAPTSQTEGGKLAAYEAEIAQLKASAEEQSRLYSELQMDLEGVEKERNFYFDKLREVEIMLQDIEDAGNGTPLSADVLKILYATAEGFEAVAEDEAAS